MAYGPAQTSESLGGDIHNGIAHHFRENPANARKMVLIEKYEARLLAYLIERLKSVGVYDDTLILWTTECSGPNHGHAWVPVYLLPGRNIPLRRGAQVDVGGNNYLKVLISAARAVGATGLKSFGAAGLGGDGPLSTLHA